MESKHQRKSSGCKAHRIGYKDGNIYKKYGAVSIPEEPGFRRHEGGSGLRASENEKLRFHDIEHSEEFQKWFLEQEIQLARSEAAHEVVSVADAPDKLEQHQGNLEQYDEAKVPLSLLSSDIPFASSTAWSLLGENFGKDLELLDLKVVEMDCPTRLDKVRDVVGGGKSAENFKNYENFVAEYKTSEPKQELLMSGKAPLRHKSLTAPITLIDVSPENFREAVQEFTVRGKQQTSEKTKAKGNKESPKLAPNEDSEFKNLPQYVRRCLTYSTLFPLDHEFEKDTVVQLWIAEELIDAKANGKWEEEAGICFDILVQKEYIVPSSFNKLYRQQKYKINESKSSPWYFQQGLSEESYVRIEEKKLEVISGTTLHLSLQKLDSTEFEAIRNCKQLRTLLLVGEYGSSIKQLPGDIFQCLKSLRTLDLSRTLISRLPTSVGCLESLHYLDLSYTPIRSLPRSIERLHGLQTLKLRECFALRALPQGMRKLTNLRHLDFDIMGQLNSMPTGMGSLTNLQTLKAFLVGREGGCGISELKDLDNLTGCFCISKLENVENAMEAKKAALNKKQYIKKLELRWGDFGDSNSQDLQNNLRYLQPHPNLEELQILFYNGSLLPSWIGNPSFTNIISITFYNCRNCYLLPCMGELPSLRILKIVGMSRLKEIDHHFCRSNSSPGLKPFPKLEKLTLENMLSLEEWTGIEDGDFPCLLQMIITCCPKLHDLPLLSHFKALKNLEISHCTALQSLPGEHQLPTLLESLIIRDCPKVKGRCCKDGGEEWLKIAHVPNIWIDDEEISMT